MTDFETLKAEYDKRCLQVEDLKAAGRKSADDAISALGLLSRVRFALGDNGKRMQDELLDYCRELRDSAGALAALGDDYDALKAERDRCRAALETIADPSTASMTHAGTVDTLRSHARIALRG